MKSAEVQNTKEQVPKLVENLKDRGEFSTFEIMQQIRLTLPAVVKFNLKNELALIKEELLPFTKKEAYTIPYNIPLHIYELIVHYHLNIRTHHNFLLLIPIVFQTRLLIEPSFAE